jgi:virginiamycin B lyase
VTCRLAAFVLPQAARSTLIFALAGGAALGWPTDAAAQLTEYPIPTSAAKPSAFAFGITTGSDGNLWFTEATQFGSGAQVIGQLTTGGVMTEWPVNLGANGIPFWITSGPDGNLWITGYVPPDGSGTPATGPVS